MNLDVIAEGVETEQHREFLQGIGCRSFQGYLFSKALPIGGFDRFVANSANPVPALASPPA
jgi:diguanylate cyclase